MGEGKAVTEMRQKARRKQSQTNAILERQAHRISKLELQELKFTNPVAFNNLAEEMFVELVRTLIAEQASHTYPILKVYQEASYEIGISPETAKRYLLRHTARRAEFTAFGKLVMLNSRYVPPEEAEPEDV